jgi:transcriptional regulator with XRE-family HTH domain
MRQSLSFGPVDKDEEVLFAEEWLIASVQSAIEQAMIAKGVSKADLAHRIGCSRASVSQSLKDGRNLTLRTVAQYLHALEVPCSVNVQSTDDGFALEWNVDARTRGVSDAQWYADVFGDHGVESHSLPVAEMGAWTQTFSSFNNVDTRKFSSGRKASDASDERDAA